MKHLLPSVLCLAVVLVLATGCGESASESSGGGSGASVPQKLPPLGDAIPRALDDGRLEVAGPKTWEWAPPDRKYLARFQESAENAYPMILISAADFEGEVFDVDGDNVNTFAKEVAAQAKATQEMTIKPIEVGNFVGVSYRRRGKVTQDFKEIILDRLLLETVASGRQYTVELRARDGELDKYRPYVLAVAGGLKFLKPDAAPAAADGDEPGGGDAPAETPEDVPAETGAGDDAPVGDSAGDEPAGQ